MNETKKDSEKVISDETQQNIRILGINISHDASIAVIDNGVVTSVYEEERCRRTKYWAPHGDKETLYQCIEQKNLEEIDEVVFTSFDRRQFNVVVSPTISLDRMKSREFIRKLETQQLSRARLEELVEEYPDDFSIEKIYENDEDQRIMDDIATNQLGLSSEEYLYNVDHHVHHAYCGFVQSEMENALVIVMDGGGCQKYYDTHPAYQEIESIYYATKGGMEPCWSRLSNSRFIGDFDEFFPNECHAAGLCYLDEEEHRDGVDLCFTSRPSAGMNFSNMSLALGTDDQGRAAGKVMGMASYGKPSQNIFNKYNVSQQLELDSYDHTVEIIKRAIDYAPDCRNIVLSGGYSLNCTNNYKYLEAFPDYQIFVDPIPHDGGTAVGAALQMWENINSNNVSNNVQSTFNETNEEDNDTLPDWPEIKDDEPQITPLEWSADK
jgi:predicted NodU family carbamoyl transferase